MTHQSDEVRSKVSESELSTAKNGPPTILGLRQVAIAEVAVALVVFAALDYFFFSADRFVNVHPHPLWLVVVFASMQYGLREGVFAAVASTLFLHVGVSAETAVQWERYDYIARFGWLPLAWLAAAVALGQVRQRQLRKRKTLVEAVDRLEKENETLHKAHTLLERHADDLQARLVGQSSLAAKAFEVAHRFYTKRGEEMTTVYLDTIMELVSPKKVSIYRLNEGQLRLIGALGWTETDEYSPQFDEHSSLFKRVVTDAAMVSVDQESDEQIIRGQGMVAAPLIHHESGSVVGMLKIEDIAFSDYNKGTLETIKIAANWVGTDMLNAGAADTNHRTATSSGLKETNDQKLRVETEFVKRLGSRFGVTSSVAMIVPVLGHDLKSANRGAVDRAFEQATAKLRLTDTSMLYGDTGNILVILLCGTDVDGARYVANKIRLLTRRQLPESLREIPLVVKVGPLDKFIAARQQLIQDLRLDFKLD